MLNAKSLTVSNLTQTVLVVAMIACCAIFANAQTEEPPGLGPAGNLVSIEIRTGVDSESCTISGRDSAQQILVMGKFSSGQIHDLTRKAEFKLEPSDFATISESGYIEPTQEGTIKLTASVDGKVTTLPITVTNIKVDLPINFANQIVPIFTKHGCNGGGCHGKSGGQNGFALSLLGFEPTEDFEYLVKEGRGRRIFPASPEQSLLLTKAIGELPHGGGKRFEKTDPSHRLIRRWIEQGMPYGKDSDPKVTNISVYPKNALMGRTSSQQVVVVAQYADGKTEDVTRMTQFDSNDVEMASVSETGLVETGTQTGSVAIMARYQGHVGVFRATVPLGISVANLPKPNNFVDELIFKNLKALGLPPSQLSDDSTFLRRVTIDIAGRLPTEDETLEFIESSDAKKRQQLVDKLLSSMDYAELFANKWNAILRNKRKANEDKVATFAFNEWIKQSFYKNKPYDQFVREIITATGDVGYNPPVAWYREVKDLSTQVEDTAQLFLGLRIQCARCHHHPFEIWSQEDYYGFAAFYSQIGKKNSPVSKYQRVYQRRVTAQARNPKTNKMVLARGLGEASPNLSPDVDARHVLADWMSNPKNPFFAKALVNRYWKHFFSRGLVDPEDDMRVTNPASNPELLDALARNFINSKFDLKQLIRTICNSKTYQLSALPNRWNAKDKQNYSRYYPKRLNAEVLLDGINQLTGTTTNFAGMPSGTRAVELPDNGFNSYFLTVFGRPESSSACECERSGDANLAQSLHLLNSNEIQNKLTDQKANAFKFSQNNELTHEEKIEQLYLTAFSRKPTQGEIEIALTYIDRHRKDVKRAYEDVIWALIITKEFMFNH